MSKPPIRMSRSFLLRSQDRAGFVKLYLRRDPAAYPTLSDTTLLYKQRYGLHSRV